MTRAEFAGYIEKYVRDGGYMLTGETLDEWRKRRNVDTPLGKLWQTICGVATNGFDPEPADGPMVVLRGKDANDFAQRAVEQMQQAAKRSRPFVGSHKLPYNSDYD